MPALLGLRIFGATGADISDLGEEHGHRVLGVCGKGTKVVLAPLHPAVGRAIKRAIGALASGPILLSSRGTGCTGTPPPLASAARGAGRYPPALIWTVSNTRYLPDSRGNQRPLM